MEQSSYEAKELYEILKPENRMKLVNNWIKYQIYFDDLLKNSKKQNLKIEDYLNQCLEIANDIIKNYLWNNECFNLKIDYENKVIYGSTIFNEDITDEWIIVYILKTISVKIAKAIINVYDNDGYFLIIEAAEGDNLPKWIQPQTAINRVYIRQGKLFIIEKNLIPLCLDEMKEANKIPIIRKYLSQIVKFNKFNIPPANKSIQKAAFSKLKNFPKDAFESNCFHAYCVMPFTTYLILKRNPGMIAKIIHNFFSTKTKGKNNSQTLVMVKIRFTHYLYCFILAQQLDDEKDLLKMNIQHLCQKLWNLDNIPKHLINVTNQKHWILGKKIDLGLNLKNPEKLLTSTTSLILHDILKENNSNKIKYENDNEDWMELTNDELQNLMQEKTGSNELLFNPEDLKDYLDDDEQEEQFTNNGDIDLQNLLGMFKNLSA